MPFVGEYREAIGFPREGTELGGFLVELVRVAHAGIRDDPSAVVDEYLRRYQAEARPRSWK